MTDVSVFRLRTFVVEPDDEEISFRGAICFIVTHITDSPTRPHPPHHHLPKRLE